MTLLRGIILTVGIAPWPYRIATAQSRECRAKVPGDSVRAVAADSSTRLQWSAADKMRVEGHIVCVGMTAAMLRTAWGRPQGIDSTLPLPGFEADTTEELFYRTATIVTVNGKVRAIRPPRIGR
jgi:hypothetical protein